MYWRIHCCLHESTYTYLPLVVPKEVGGRAKWAVSLVTVVARLVGVALRSRVGGLGFADLLGGGWRIIYLSSKELVELWSFFPRSP